jgi:hypothetical protein
MIYRFSFLIFLVFAITSCSMPERQKSLAPKPLVNAPFDLCLECPTLSSIDSFETGIGSHKLEMNSQEILKAFFLCEDIEDISTDEACRKMIGCTVPYDDCALDYHCYLRPDARNPASPKVAVLYAMQTDGPSATVKLKRMTLKYFFSNPAFDHVEQTQISPGIDSAYFTQLHLQLANRLHALPIWREKPHFQPSKHLFYFDHSGQLRYPFSHIRHGEVLPSAPWLDMCKCYYMDTDGVNPSILPTDNTNASQFRKIDATVCLEWSSSPENYEVPSKIPDVKNYLYNLRPQDLAVRLEFEFW